MGCANSKVDNEEGVARCNQRKRLMKQTVASRHNFAASHVQFVVSLKGVGSAFRQFAEGEVKDADTTTTCPPETPRTPRTPSLSLGPPPPPLLSPRSFSSGLTSVFSPGPLHSPSHVNHVELRSPNSRAASSPDSSSMDFLPPPPPIISKEYRMEHTPSIVPSKIYRFEETPNSQMPELYKLDESSLPSPLIQPIQFDDDWRYTNHNPPTSNVARKSNPPNTPPNSRGSWQDIFMDPFRPVPPTFNYMQCRRNQESEERQSQKTEERRREQESDRRWIEEAEQRRKKEVEQRVEEKQRKAKELEDLRIWKREQRKVEVMEKSRAEVVPPKQPLEVIPERSSAVDVECHEVVPEVNERFLDQGIPELEEADVPDLEDVDELLWQPAMDTNEEKVDNFAEEPEPESETPQRGSLKVQDQSPKPLKATKTAKSPAPSRSVSKPPKPEQREYAAVKANTNLAVIRAENDDRDLLDVLKEVDDYFLKAAESGENVARMLETKKAHYHSSFSDSLKVVGESARINFLKLSGKSGLIGKHSRTSSNASALTDDTASITSMRSVSNMSVARWSEECGLTGSHAGTLDKLNAWEKKLYLEVKEAEAIRIELERKYHLFRNQDAKNEDQTNIDKTRASIKSLQSRMAVAIQAVDSAAHQVQKLKDEELYPQLLELLEGLGTMWRDMSFCHQAQLKAVEAMKKLDYSAACMPTTSSHRHSTAQLEIALNKWSEGLGRFVQSQRDYLKNLTAWLRLSLMHFGSEELERSGSRSPLRSPGSPFQNTESNPIYSLCQRWQDALDQLADRVVLEAIGSFAAVVREMLSLQWEELRIKKRAEAYHRELEKRENALMSAAMRDPGSMPPPVPQTPSTTSGSDLDDGRSDNRSDSRYDIVPREGFSERAEVAEKRLKMEATRRKLEDELESERKAHTDTRAYTLNSLQAGLPQLFQAVIAFSNLEAEVHEKLNSGQKQPRQ